jgi:hypothetical protein
MSLQRNLLRKSAEETSRLFYHSHIHLTYPHADLFREDSSALTAPWKGILKRRGKSLCDATPRYLCYLHSNWRFYHFGQFLTRHYGVFRFHLFILTTLPFVCIYITATSLVHDDTYPSLFSFGHRYTYTSTRGTLHD